MRHLSFAFLTWRRYQQRRLVPFGITLKQLHVLRQLSRNDYLYPSQIAEMLFCDRPTATVVVRNMVRQGWVTREQDEQDRRQVRVILTAKGRAKLGEVTRTQPSEVERQIDPLEHFDKDEIAELDRLLTKLNERLRQIAETTEGAARDRTE
jgi:DNA-binding MarR family transcriptional regulator